MDLTSDFVHCRLHGSEDLYSSGYDDKALDRWAKCVRAWTGGRERQDGDFVGDPADSMPTPRDVFLFFDNTDKRHAPLDAQRLMKKLGRTWAPPADEKQLRLL